MGDFFWKSKNHKNALIVTAVASKITRQNKYAKLCQLSFYRHDLANILSTYGKFGKNTKND